MMPIGGRVSGMTATASGLASVLEKRLQVLSGARCASKMFAVTYKKGPGDMQGVFSNISSGTPGRTRTADTRFRKPLLYPLSYRGT